MTTKIMPCSCKHAEQDKLYGVGMRLHNERKRRNKQSMEHAGWTCTVCGHQIDATISTK